MKVEGKKIKDGLKNIFKKFYQKLYLLLILLLVLDLVLAGLLFSKYYLKAQEKEIEPPLPLEINQSLLNEFSSLQKEREKLFEAAQTKDYPQLFQGQ